MKVSIIQPASFLYFTSESISRDTCRFLPVSEQLYREAVGCKMQVCGALQYHYHNFKTGTNALRIDVALPVQSPPQGYDGIFHLKRTEPYKCVEAIHPGPWTDLSDTYRLVMEYAGANGLEINHHNREVYVVYDAGNPAANLTWVLVGVS